MVKCQCANEYESDAQSFLSKTDTIHKAEKPIRNEYKSVLLLQNTKNGNNDVIEKWNNFSLCNQRFIN